MAGEREWVQCISVLVGSGNSVAMAGLGALTAQGYDRRVHAEGAWVEELLGEGFRYIALAEGA